MYELIYSEQHVSMQSEHVFVISGFFLWFIYRVHSCYSTCILLRINNISLFVYTTLCIPILHWRDTGFSLLGLFMSNAALILTTWNFEVKSKTPMLDPRTSENQTINTKDDWKRKGHTAMRQQRIWSRDKAGRCWQMRLIRLCSRL